MFLPIRPLKTREYFFSSLFIFIYPFFTLFLTAFTPTKSDYYLNLAIVISMIWMIWVIVSTIFKLYRKIVFRLLPICLVLNIGSFFGILLFWRETGEDLFFGILLLFSYFSAFLFSYLNPKFIFTFKYRLESPKVMIFLLFFGSMPIIWYIYGLQFVDLSKRYLYTWGSACFSLYMTFLITALTICYREPGWTPEQELNRKKEEKDF